MKIKITKIDLVSYAIYITIAAIFFFSFGLAGRQPYNYVNIALWAVLGGFYFLLRRLKKIKLFHFRYDGFALAMAIYCATMVISNALAGFRSFSVTGIVCALSSLMIYWMLSDGIVSKKTMLACICVGAIGYLLLFAVVYRNDVLHPNFSKRIGTFFDNQNEVALNSGLCAMFLFALFFETKKWYLKIVSAIFFLLAFYTILLTGSVSGVLTTSLVFACVLPFFFKSRRSRFAVAISELSLLAIAIVILLASDKFSYYAGRINGMLSSLGLASGSGDGSAETRLNSILAGLRIFMENPLFGAGDDSVHYSYEAMAHNNFAEVLADYGIFAFVAYEALMIIPIWKFRKSTGDYKRFVIPILFFAFFFQFFLFTFNSKPICLLLAVCFYLVFPDGLYVHIFGKRSNEERIDVQTPSEVQQAFDEKGNVNS
jgi:O-antigen ligase